jgi:beta-barrel assembly-enhancing protease
MIGAVRRLTLSGRRFTATTAAVALVVAQICFVSPRCFAQDLPDIGSPANALLSLDDEYRIGLMVVRGLRDQGRILDDAEVSEYLQDIGNRLSSHAQEGAHQFYFFAVRDPSINAFALPGGFIGVNSGLVLATANENELAGVLAHEISHVTQRHIARSIADQSHTSLVSTAAMLAAILLGATAGASGDAMQGAIAITQGAAMQRQINYTRDNEAEADRVGIAVMSAAGFDPLGMPSFFETLSHRYPAGKNQQILEMLQDHPVTSARIAETRSRAMQLGRIRSHDTQSYSLARERLRSLVGQADVARNYYLERDKNGAPLTQEERYGRAFAALQVGDVTDSVPEFESLVREFPKVTQYHSALGQALLAADRKDESRSVLEKAVRLFPRNISITVRLAETLMETGDNKRAHHILLDLFNVVPPTPEQAKLIARAANAAGDVADSYYYMSEYHIMSGDLLLAVNQLQLALALPGINAVQRARFSARLAEIREVLPKDNARPRGGEGANRGITRQ